MENFTDEILNRQNICDDFNYELALFLTVLFMISMFGNSTVLVIFGRRKFTPAILLFLVLAALDISLLLFQFLFTTMPILCQYTSGCKPYADATIYLAAYAFPFVAMIYCISTWVVVLMACNRYLAITKPLEHNRIITIKQTWIKLTIISALAIAYNFPRFFEYQTNGTVNATTTIYFAPKTAERLSELFRNKYYQIYYKILSFLILFIFVPLVLLSYFTFKLIREIRQSNRRRKALFHGSQFRTSVDSLTSEEQSITFTLLAVVIAFILSHIPIGINRVLQLVFYYKYNSIECIAIDKTMYFISRVLNSFAEMNAAFNFVIYGVTSPQFRRDLKVLCKFKQISASTERRNLSITLDRNSNRRNNNILHDKQQTNEVCVPEFGEMSI